MPVPPYPAILLAANWNGKKSTAAKILFPTKLGEELKAFEGAYKLVKWPLAYNIPPDNAPLKIVDDQIMEWKMVFKGELDHLKATGAIAKTHAVKIRGEWASNPLVPKDLKTYLDNIIKNFDPLLAKIDHDTQENFHKLLATRAKIAAANPQDANAALQAAGTKVVTRDKNAPKSNVLKFKAPPPPPPKKDKESDSSESESEDSSAPQPPVTKPRSGSTPPPPPPKGKEKESRESESDETSPPKRPTTPPPPPPKSGTAGSAPKPPTTPPPRPTSPPPKSASSSRTPPPPPPKGKEKESRESESEDK